jgi:hypothetical protein
MREPKVWAHELPPINRSVLPTEEDNRRALENDNA